ncbi:ankyrin repeat domain-containing protein 26-like isoform X2 [Mirounga angustirostris]|uniref:ankyrin repeat domain-containing protein 26-like isoform X2 n=1 Tax=Mirounga angustirostris TaxID=9716 RepID=UPI00313BAB46
MKKFFSFGSKKGGSSFRVTSSRRDGPGILPERRIGTNSFGWGYNIRDKDLRKIHKVASMGNVRKLQKILLSGKHGVDERDRMNRTALHLACANGHPDVVTVLVERKCQLDLFDKDYRTALMKAVQCQDERCVSILLEHGADPNLTDIAGNTALHYAALGSNTSIAEKLLLHHANIEVRNKDELTPFLLAVSENKQQMVEFLIEKEANVHAVDKLQRTALMLAVHYDSADLVRVLLQQGINIFSEDACGWTAEEYSIFNDLKVSRQLIAEHREEKLNNYLQSKNAVADKSAEEESLSSISVKPGTDDSWPTSDDEDFNFDIKTVPKPNLRALMNASEQFKNVGTKCGLITLGGRTLSEHDNSDYEDENIVGLLYKPPFKANDFSCPAFSKPSVKSLAGHGVIKEGEVQPATGKKDNGVNITEIAPQEQTVNDHLTSADRAYKSNSSVTMSALGLGEEEDGESPWDSESISESPPKKDIKHLFGAADQKGPRILNEQVEDSPKSYPYVKPTVEVKDSVPNKTVEVKEKQASNSDWPAELDLERTSEEEQKRLDESENNHLKDKGISQTCILAEKTCENQAQQINVPLLHLQKKSREPEMNKKCDRKDNISVYSEHPSVQKREEISIKQGKLVWKNNLKHIISELKWKFGETCEKQKIAPYPKEESLRGNFKEGANLMEIPSNLTNDRLDCEKKHIFAVPVPLVVQAFPEQKNSSLKYACQASSDFSLSENKSDCENDSKPDTEHVFNKNKSFKSDTETKKVRNPLATFEVKEDQEFDVQMAKSMNQNSTNSKLDIGRIPQSSDSESHFDKRFSRSNEMRQMAQIKRHHSSAVTNIYKKTKVLFQKPFCAVNNSTNNYRSMEPELENVSSSPPCSYRTSEVCLKEELQQDVQKFKNEIGMLQIDIWDLEKKKVQLQKEINEEKKRHQRNETAVLENIYAVAAAAAGLIQQRESGKTENHLFPVGKKEDFDGSDPGLHMKGVRKDENEKWTSEVSVITPGLEKADSLPSRPVQVNDDSTSSEMDQDEVRPAKKTSHEKKEVKKQINFMDDLDLTESSGTASEDSKLPCSNYMSCKSLTVQVGQDRKDSTTLLEIQDAILSYQKLVELKNQCKQLKRKNKEMENKVNGLQKELSETKELKLQLEHQKVKWEQELGSLRFTFTQEEEKRRNADKLYEKMREQFREKEEQYNKEVEMKQQLELRLATVGAELRTVRNNLDQVVEERNDAKLQLSREQNARVQDGILKNHLCKQKEIEVTVRHLQLELADSLKKQSMSEASLEVTSRCRINFEDETQNLRKKLGQIRSQLQEAQDRHAEAVRCIETSKDHMQKLEVENAKLKVTVKNQARKIEQLQENLLSTSLGQIKKFIELKERLECSLDQEMKKNGELEKEITRFKKLLNVTRRKLSEYEGGELTFPGNSKTNQIEMDSQINMLKQKVDDLTAKLETASSKCLYLDANNQLLTQELTSMKEMQKKYEKLKKNKKKLEQQVVNFRSHAEFSMVEYSKIEQYKRELEERARLDITEKLKEANLFFQRQIASQESLGQIRETTNALMRNQMETRIEDLEFELSRMKSSQDFYETELEKYKRLYLGELKVQTSLSNELKKTNEKLAGRETSTKLLVETQEKTSLINTIAMTPVLELPSVRNMNNSSLLNTYVAPRENLVIPTSSSWPKKNGIETFLTKMQQEMERNITRELEEEAAEFELDSWHMTSSLECTYESYVNDDLLAKSSKEFLQT